MTAELILESLRRDFVFAARIAGLSEPPSQYVVVVDRYGETMSSKRTKPILSHRKSHQFCVGLVKWLEQMSTKLIDVNTQSATDALRIEAAGNFAKDKIEVFSNLEDAAAWYADPKFRKLDAFVGYFISTGLPIYAFSIARDQP